MDIAPWVWWLTLVVTSAILLSDVVIIGRRPHEPSTKECAIALAAYVGLAVLFGVGITVVSGGRYGTEFFAGWLTEYSLSVDNLFIFVIIMSAFKVPAIQQHRVLLIGIVLALIMRGLFLAAGAVVISHFSWVVYLFAALLIYLGWRQVRHRHQQAALGGNTE